MKMNHYSFVHAIVRNFTFMQAFTFYALPLILICLVYGNTTFAQTYPDWPQRGGVADFGTRSGSQDLNYVSSFAYGKLLWESETLPRTRGGHGAPGRFGCGNRTRLGGSAASPIIYDDKVYLWLYRPVGGPDSIYDKDMVATYNNCTEATQDDIIYTLGVLAEGALLCWDLKTGSKLWEVKHAEYGYVPEDQTKRGLIRNYTPAAGEGKVFCIETSGYLYAHDAITGAELWKSKLPNFNIDQAIKAENIAKQEQQGPKRGNGSNVVYADGVVVAPGHIGSDEQSGSILSGYDAKTGQQLWSGIQQPHFMLPHLWKHGNKTYLIVKKETKLELIDLRTGQALWSLNIQKGILRNDITFSQKYLIATQLKDGKTVPTFYEMTPQGVTELWRMDVPGFDIGIVVGDTAFVITDESQLSRSGVLKKVNIKTKEVHPKTRVISIPHENSVFFAGGYIWSLKDGNWGATNINTMEAAAAVPQVAATGSYDFGLAPAFTRGIIVFREFKSIRAYDVSDVGFIPTSIDFRKDFLPYSLGDNLAIEYDIKDQIGEFVVGNFTKNETWKVIEGQGQISSSGVFTSTTAGNSKVLLTLNGKDTKGNDYTISDTVEIRAKSSQNLILPSNLPVLINYIPNEPFNLGVSASSGLPITYEKDFGVIRIEGLDSIMPLFAGTARVIVWQKGNDFFEPTEKKLIQFRLVNAGGATPSYTVQDTVVGIYDEIHLGNENDIVVYPNPSNGQINIKSSLESMDKIQVYDVYGELISEEDVEMQAVYSFDLSHLSNGIYFIKVVEDNGSSKTVRFILQK